jgi:hypothetical protein
MLLLITVFYGAQRHAQSVGKVVMKRSISVCAVALFLGHQSVMDFAASSRFTTHREENSRGFAAGAVRIDYRIAGSITPRRQPSANSCWATVAAMMFTWKAGRDYALSDIAKLAGSDYESLLASDSGSTGLVKRSSSKNSDSEPKRRRTSRSMAG